MLPGGAVVNGSTTPSLQLLTNSPLSIPIINRCGLISFHSRDDADTANHDSTNTIYTSITPHTFVGYCLSHFNPILPHSVPFCPLPHSYRFMFSLHATAVTIPLIDHNEHNAPRLPIAPTLFALSTLLPHLRCHFSPPTVTNPLSSLDSDNPSPCSPIVPSPLSYYSPIALLLLLSRGFPATLPYLVLPVTATPDQNRPSTVNPTISIPPHELPPTHCHLAFISRSSLI